MPFSPPITPPRSSGAPSPGGSDPIRVLVTDDSVVVRKLVSQALSMDPAIEVVGTAANGRIALTKVRQLNPDLVTMDIEMPEMDGITAVRELRASGYARPIVMCSTLTERGASATLDALAEGASDYVTKPSNTGSIERSLNVMTAELLPKVHALVPRRRRGAPTPRPVTASPHSVPARTAGQAAVELVAIGSSTGGPSALATLVEGLTARPRVPIVVVQHMPPVFTRQLADRLARIGTADVVEAQHGDTLRPGTIYIAPGDRHLEISVVAGLGVVRLNDRPPVNFCRPAVDVLFRSVVASYGAGVLGVVLTGMGADGAEGARAISAAGGTVFAQDQATSVVWGMPRAVAEAGVADALLPLSEVAGAIEKAIARRTA